MCVISHKPMRATVKVGVYTLMICLSFEAVDAGFNAYYCTSYNGVNEFHCKG